MHGADFCLGHQTLVTLDCGALVKKSLTLLGGIGSSGGFEKAIKTIQARPALVAQMITRTIPLSEAEAFFREGLDRQVNVKIMIGLTAIP